MSNAIVVQSQISITEKVNAENILDSLSRYTLNTYVVSATLEGRRTENVIDAYSAKRNICIISVRGRGLALIAASDSTTVEDQDLLYANCGTPVSYAGYIESGFYNVTTAIYIDDAQNIYDFSTGALLCSGRYVWFIDTSSALNIFSVGFIKVTG